MEYEDSGVYDKLGRVKLWFIVGRDRSDDVQSKIINESRSFDDMIRGDFYDHYHNMTIKNIFGFVKVNQFCNYKFLVKADDDVFINFPLILLHLSKVSGSEPLYIGWPCEHSFFDFMYISYYGLIKFQQRLANFKMTTSDYPFPRSPNYAYGFMYIMSRASVDIIVKTYNYIPYVRIIDDVYVSYILARSNVTCCPSTSFVYGQADYSNTCQLNNILGWSQNSNVPRLKLKTLEEEYKKAAYTWTHCDMNSKLEYFSMNNKCFI